MHVSWKLVEVGQNFLAGYKEVYLGTQFLQECPNSLSCLEFARELHERLSQAYKADPEAMIFVLTTVSISRKGAPINTPLLDGISGDVPPPKRTKWDSDVEIDLGGEG